MADSTLNSFIGRGTTTQRLAFTPSAPTPASGPDQGYLWWDTTLQEEFAYDFGTAAWVSTAGGAASAITALTGDVTATGPGSVAATLAATAVTAGTYGDSTHVAQVTVDAKGRLTGASNVSIAGSGIGDVTGPSSATDNAIARFDTTTGKLIQNSTPTVEDDGTIASVTDPVNLQDASTKNYVDTQIAAVNVGGATQNSFLVSGGGVVWDSAYTFTVSAATYYIAGVQFTSAEQSVSLSAADPTNDRIDLIAVDDTGTVVAITGTPAAQPSEPDYDPATQLKLSIVFVGAATTAPSVTSTLLYADDAGSPTEWNWTTSGSGFNVSSTNNPRSPSTKCIEGTTVANNAYAQGQIGTGTFDPNSASLLVLYIRSKATWANKRVLQVQLLNSGVIVGTPITLAQGSFGFDSSQTSSYQQIAIPVTQFAITTGTLINQIRIRDSGGSIGFYLDDISFQGGATTQVAAGITQAQADARYADLTPSYVTLATDATLPNERVLTAGSGITLTDGGAGSTVTIAATGGGGTVTHTAGALTANELVVGNGSADLKTVAATDGQVPIGKSSDGSVTLATLTGTANEVIVTNGAASVTLSTPQAIGTSSTPQFGRLGLGTAAASTAKLKVAGQFYVPEITDTVSAGAATIDWDAGNEHYLSLTANTTLTFSNPNGGGRYVLLLQQDATGSRTVTWPATVLWSGGTAPTLTTTANKTDLFTFMYSAVLSKYIGNSALNF